VIEDVAVLVAGRRAQNFHVDQSAVFAQIAFDVARLVSLAVGDAPMGVFGDPHVLGVGKGLGVLAHHLLAIKADHLAKRVVRRDDTVI
jgi:hypothetical protein